MSLSDVKNTIEETVIQPLQHFRALASSLDHMHNDCLTTFSQNMAGLLTGSDGDIAFQGPGSVALANLIGDYLNAAQALTGTFDTFLCERLSDAAAICEKYARQLQDTLDSINPPQLGGAAQAVGGFAIAADAGAAAQLGLDPVWDVVAAGASGLAIGLALGAATSEQSAIDQANQAKFLTITQWQTEMDSGPNTEPLQKFPPEPEGPDGNDTSFLKTIGIITGTTIVLGALGALTWNAIKGNAAKRQQALDALQQEFPECDRAFLEQFLDAHPDVPLDQIERALEVQRLRAQYQEFLNELMKNNDPALRNGIGKLRAKIRGLLKGLNTIDPFTASASQIQSWQGNLDGLWAEWQIAQQDAATGNLTSYSTPVPYTNPNGKSTTADADILVNGGKTWISVKNTPPFDLNSPKWPALETDAAKDFQAASQNGITEVVFDFPQGVSSDVMNALQNLGAKYGIKVTFQSSSIAPPPAGTGWCTPSSSAPSGTTPTPAPTSPSPSSPGGPGPATPTPTP